MSFTSQCKKVGPLVGGVLALGTHHSAEVVGRIGYDYVLIDMEHSPLSAKEAGIMVHAVVAASNGKCLPIIRVPSHGVEWIKWALDSGAKGIIIPMVNTAEEMEGVIQRAIYPPRGQRSFGPFLAPFADLADDSDVAKYVTKTVKDVAILPIIESVEGVKNAEAILGTDGVSGCFIGPFDLRQSMGLPGGDGHESQFVQALQKVVAINKKMGKVTGIFAGTEESSAEKSKMGFDFLLNGGDATYLAKGAADCLAVSRAGVRAAKI